MKRQYLGEFEELVLLVSCILAKEGYGVAIQQELEQQTGRVVAISAVHTALHRLERKGFLQSWVGGATNVRGGRRKRFFEVTSEGRDALAEARRVRESLWQLIPEPA